MPGIHRVALTYFVRKLGFEPSFHLTTGTFNLFVKDLKLGCRLSGPCSRCPLTFTSELLEIDVPYG